MTKPNDSNKNCGKNKSKRKRVMPFEHIFTKGERRGLDLEEIKVYYMPEYNNVLYSLIPLHKYNTVINGVERGKTPVQKIWQKSDSSEYNPETCIRAGHNIGVRIEDGLLVVDVDPRNYKNGIDSLRKLLSTCGFLLETYPYVVTGGGGYHIYMLLPDRLTGLRESHPDYPGIEFKTKGQVVAAGSVHPNGITYEWGLFSPPLASISRAPGKLIELLQVAKNVNSELTGMHTPEQLAKMLEGLNPAEFRIHREWLALMMACHHATAGDGIEEFIEWSISDPYYAHHAARIERRWDSLYSNGTGKITYKTLYDRLHKKGKGALIPPPTTAEEDFEPVNFEDVKAYL